MTHTISLTLNRLGLRKALNHRRIDLSNSDRPEFEPASTDRDAAG
jgi:hypothetical protein